MIGLAAAYALCLVLSRPADSVAAEFTDAAAFQSAIAALPQTGTLDFEAIPADTLLSAAGIVQPVGASGASATFPASVPDVFAGPALDLEVNGLTTPGTNVLGVDDPDDVDQFGAGTSLSLSLSPPVQAFGLTIISVGTPNRTLRDGDLVLSAGGASVSLVVADRSVLGSANLVGGGTQAAHAYFLGLTSETPFSSVTLSAGVGVPDGAHFYWIDDVVVGVPEPSAGVLPALATLLAAIGRRQRARTAPRR